MAGPGQDKGRPDTSGHKRSSVKKNWEGCFMALRMDILVKTRPQPPTVTVSSLRKKRARIQEWIQISSWPWVRHLKDYHPILRRIILHGISCWWKKALPSYVFIFRNWQSIVFHEKKNSGSRYWWRDRGERVIRDVIIWSFWGCLKFKLRTTEHLSF